MNPFDQPPTEPPVSLDPPSGPGRAAGRDGADGPRRGRMAIAALAAAGLVGGGIVVAGQFASADEPSLGAATAVDEPATDDTGEDESDASTDDANTDVANTDDANTDDASTDDANTDDGGTDAPTIDGEIVIDDGDGDPLVLDLGAIGECVGPILRDGPLFDRDGRWSGEGRPPMPFDEEFHQRMEEFLDQLPGDELGELGDDGVRIFGSGGSTITVVGPDGVEVIDLGDGDATVTIEQTDGELTVETDGDATVSELPDFSEMFPNLGDLESGELDLGGLLPHLDELDLGELDLGELDLGELDLGELEDGELRRALPFDLDGIESCLDDLETND